MSIVHIICPFYILCIHSLLCIYPFSFRLYFIAIAMSGGFSVTFSIVFAYVADCTSEKERSYAYGLVSHTH